MKKLKFGCAFLSWFCSSISYACAKEVSSFELGATLLSGTSGHLLPISLIVILVLSLATVANRKFFRLKIGNAFLFAITGKGLAALVGFVLLLQAALYIQKSDCGAEGLLVDFIQPILVLIIFLAMAVVEASILRLRNIYWLKSLALIISCNILTVLLIVSMWRYI